MWQLFFALMTLQDKHNIHTLFVKVKFICQSLTFLPVLWLIQTIAYFLTIYIYYIYIIYLHNSITDCVQCSTKMLSTWLDVVLFQWYQYCIFVLNYIKYILKHIIDGINNCLINKYDKNVSSIMIVTPCLSDGFCLIYIYILLFGRSSKRTIIVWYFLAHKYKIFELRLFCSPWTGFELTPLLHCSTNHLTLCPAT
jgi:hypothetical protein